MQTSATPGKILEMKGLSAKYYDQRRYRTWLQRWLRETVFLKEENSFGIGPVSDACFYLSAFRVPE